MCSVLCSNEVDVKNAVNSSLSSFNAWSESTPVERGNILFKLVNLMKTNSGISQKYCIRDRKANS